MQQKRKLIYIYRIYIYIYEAILHVCIIIESALDQLCVSGWVVPGVGAPVCFGPTDPVAGRSNYARDVVRLISFIDAGN
jgi:hypothetical protein